MFTWLYTPTTGSKIVSGFDGPRGPFLITLANGSHFLVGGVMLPIRRASGRRASRGLAVRLAQAALRGAPGYVIDANGDVAVYVAPCSVDTVLGRLREGWVVAIRANLDTDGIVIEDAELAVGLAAASPLAALSHEVGEVAVILTATYEDNTCAVQSIPIAQAGAIPGCEEEPIPSWLRACRSVDAAIVAADEEEV